jgi:hypothetical protein
MSDLGYSRLSSGCRRRPPANFQVVYASAGACTTGGTKPAYDLGWEAEATLDIQWVHAMAPCDDPCRRGPSDSPTDLFAGVAVASQCVAANGGGEVSMSWGFSERFHSGMGGHRQRGGSVQQLHGGRARPNLRKRIVVPRSSQSVHGHHLRCVQHRTRLRGPLGDRRLGLLHWGGQPARLFRKVGLVNGRRDLDRYSPAWPAKRLRRTRPGESSPPSDRRFRSPR